MTAELGTRQLRVYFVEPRSIPTRMRSDFKVS